MVRSRAKQPEAQEWHLDMPLTVRPGTVSKSVTAELKDIQLVPSSLGVRRDPHLRLSLKSSVEFRARKQQKMSLWLFFPVSSGGLDVRHIACFRVQLRPRHG